jgi:DNA-binding Lrp family transcriptional regulator
VSKTAVVAERDGSRDGRLRGLDQVDLQILDALREDARLSVRAVADQVHISRAAAHARIARLERDGVIKGYAARVDPERLGLPVSAMIQLRIAQHTWKEVRARIQAIPEVWQATLVSGDYDIVLLVRTTDAAALRDLVLDRLQAIPGVRTTQTLLVLDEVGGVPAGRESALGPKIVG